MKPEFSLAEPPPSNYPPVITVTAPAPSTDPVPDDFVLMTITNGRGRLILSMQYDGLLVLGPGCQPTAAARAFEQAINIACAVNHSQILPFPLRHAELSWWKKWVIRVATWLVTSRNGGRP